MHKLNKRIDIPIYYKNFNGQVYNLFCYGTGICLYLEKARSEVDSYDCKSFKYGCPTGPYFGSTDYKCENLMLLNSGKRFTKKCLSYFLIDRELYKNKEDINAITIGVFNDVSICFFQ